MPVKNFKHNINKIDDTKNIARDRENLSSPWLEEYRDCFTFKMKPITEAFIDRFSKDIISWANDPKSLRISQFFNGKGIPGRTYWGWTEKYEKIKDAHEYALSVIADRREIGALERKYDSGYIANTMVMYDFKWREMVEWRSNLKAQESKSSSNPITVILPPIENSDLVPIRKDQDGTQ